MKSGQRIDDVKTLDELLVFIRSMDGDDYVALDMTSLPTFGGDEPLLPQAPWSWDETRALVQTSCSVGWKLIPRLAEEV